MAREPTADRRPALKDMALTELELAIRAAVNGRPGRAAELAKRAGRFLRRLEAEVRRRGGR